MKNKTLYHYLFALLLGFFSVQVAQAQFTAGNLALFVAASPNATNTTGSIVEINKTSIGQSAITTYDIPSTTSTLSNQLRFNGKAQSTGTCYLSNSNDFTLLSFTGANTINTTSNVTTLTTRGVGSYNGSGSYNLATTYTASGSARTATTINNVDWYIAESTGFYTNGSSTPDPTTETRSVKSFGGVVYGLSNSSSSVFTISATSSPVYSNLTGISPPSGMLDFYLISSGSNGSTFDVLYIITASTIYKYSLVSGSWTANGNYTVPSGQNNQNWNLAAEPNGSGAYLYVTAGDINYSSGTVNPANNVFRYTDQAGYNATLNISSTRTTLYTASLTAVVKGIAFVPNKKTLGSLNTSSTNHVVESPLLASYTTQPIFGFSISSEGIATLSGLTLNVSRAISNSDISNVKLWRSTTNDYNTGTLTNLGNIASPSGTSINFSGLSNTISNGNNYYFLTCDVASGVSGSTAAMQISLPNSGIIATGTNVTGGIITGINYSFQTTNAWTGLSSYSWSNNNNWSLNTVPTSTDYVLINSGTPQLDIDFSVSNKLIIANTGVLTVNAGKTLSIASGGTADFGGKLVTLKSDATGTAAIGTIAGTLSNATNVTVERFIPRRRAFRFLASPVNTSNFIAGNWQQATHITGSTTGQNGFDQSVSGTASLFTYNISSEAWAAIPNTSATNLTIGTGYRMLVRGDRTINLNTTAQDSAALVLSATGSIVTGNVVFGGGSVSSSPAGIPALNAAIGSGANNSTIGWSLIGNPYACAVDWSSVTKSNVSSTFATWNVNNAGRGSYVYHNGSAGTGFGASNIINSGQSIFVQTTAANPSITFTEASKVTATPPSHFKKGLSNVLNIDIFIGDRAYDALTVLFNAENNNDYDANDFVKLVNPEINFYSYLADGTRLAMNNMKEIGTETIVPLGLNGVFNGGSYELKFSNQNTFAHAEVKLKDKFINKTYDLKSINNLVFTVTADSNSYGENRFELIFSKSATGLNNELTSNNNNFIVFPNPANNVLNLSLTTTKEDNYSYAIFNQLGAEISNGQLNFNSKRTHALNIENLSNGVYFIQVKNGQSSQTIKFIK